MCELTTIGMVLSVVSTVAQGYSAMQQGKYEQDVAEYNARQSENEATRTRNVGVEEENRQRRLMAEMVSRQRAQGAAGGVDVESGSALQQQVDVQTLGEADALRIRSTFGEQADVLDEEASLTRAQGEAASSAGRSAFTGSLLGAGVSIFASPVASKWFTPSSAAVTSGSLTGGELSGPLIYNTRTTNAPGILS